MISNFTERMLFLREKTAGIFDLPAPNEPRPNLNFPSTTPISAGMSGALPDTSLGTPDGAAVIKPNTPQQRLSDNPVKVPELPEESPIGEAAPPPEQNWLQRNALPLGIGAGALGLGGLGYLAYDRLFGKKKKRPEEEKVASVVNRRDDVLQRLARRWQENSKNKA